MSNNIFENFRTPWSNRSNREYDSWHSMCSYLGAFPPSLANYFIRYFTKTKATIFDPFSGRGTTLLESRILGRTCIATDLNPIALSLSEAKNVSLKVEEIYNRINDLERKYDPSLYQQEANAQPDEVHLIFHPRTLAQLCYLKRKLLYSDNNIDKFLVGIALGILHGGERSDGTSGYASIAMPNTFSMSPDYVRKFVQTNQLNRLFRDVFSLLKEKTDRLYKKHSEFRANGIVQKADAKQLSQNQILQKFSRSVDLILTSPPYLGVVNYAKQNWIRSWFLNQNPIKVSEELDDDLNLEEWLIFIKTVLSELKIFLKEDGVAVLVVGDVAKSKNSIISLARELLLMNKELSLFKNAWCINDVIDRADKTTKIWSETKGKATAIDRIVILSDINPFEKFKNKKNIEKLNIDIIEQMTNSLLGLQ